MKEPAEDSSQMSTSNFMETFLERHQPPKEAVEHFSSIPWTSAFLNDAAYKHIPTFSRHLKTSGEDHFFSRTVNTENTIPHMVSLQLKDFKTLPEDNSAYEHVKSSNKKPTTAPEKPDAVILLQLGKKGLDGHPATIHGGMTCAILDETMGLLCMLHHNNIRGPGPRDSLYTANLSVNYRAPVPTPNQVVVKCWLVRRQGRKWYTKGQIVDEQGTVLADADGIWVMTKRAKL